MVSQGVIRVWHHDEGWGVIDSPDTPGGCRVDSGAVMVEAVCTDAETSSMGLQTGETVDFVWGPVGGDDQEFSVETHAVWPSRCDPPDEVPHGAFRTSLWTSAGSRGEFTVCRQVDPSHLPPAPPRPPLRRTTGTVKEWNPDEGWGVIDSPETPGGAWVFFSEIRGQTGFRALTPGANVEFAWEAAEQDGYHFRGSDIDIIE